METENGHDKPRGGYDTIRAFCRPALSKYWLIRVLQRGPGRLPSVGKEDQHLGHLEYTGDVKMVDGQYGYGTGPGGCFCHAGTWPIGRAGWRAGFGCGVLRRGRYWSILPRTAGTWNGGY